jgi:uncharacterized secreted protein with C-terminal beta-propeller domain
MNKNTNKRNHPTSLFKTVAAIALIAMITLIVAACKAPVDNKSPPVTSTSLASQNILKFGNMEELIKYLADSNANTLTTYGGGRGIADGVMTIAKAEGASPSAVSPTASADDYSHTNVQVQGVDEGDFVKNDGRYIYMISGSEFVIVDALDPKNAQIVSETSFKDPGAKDEYRYGKELFVNGNKLVMFVEGYDQGFYFQKYDIQPIPIQKAKTIVYIYDITNRANPDLVDTYSVSGNYFSSRMIKDIVYLVTQDGVNYPYVVQPVVLDDMKDSTIMRPDIYYFDNKETNYQFNTVTSVDLKDNSVKDSKTFMLGYSSTLMVSEDNIYIAYQKNNYWCWGWRCGYNNNNDDSKNRFEKVVVPLLKGEVKTDIQTILDKDISDDEKWQQISLKLSDFYEKIGSDEQFKNQYEIMFNDIEDALAEYDEKKALDNQETIIHRIAIDDGKIEYGGKGSVTGRLQNQFSMDEFKGNLRVATTIDTWTNHGRINYNNVYVLNNNMEVIGKAENLAQNESIYSTRFMGDKLYMVTFRQIDPFFVIDLSNAASPKVLGTLKIPGYSSYLHPLNDKYIIGVGKETGENQWGGTSVQGIKVSLFDVSDFEHPKEVDTYVIGDQGSDSAVLYDHRAFLYSESKGIMVIPVTQVEQRMTKSGYGYYSYKTWNGAYVFKVSEKGFDLFGKVKHSSSSSDYFNWWNQATVTRSLYLDDALYTISNKYIKANDLANNLTELKSIDLPGTENYYPGQPVPVDVGGGIGSAGVIVE